MTGSENDHENMAIWLGFPTGADLGGKIIFSKNNDIGVAAEQGKDPQLTLDRPSWTSY